MIRLGDGTEESKRRIQESIDDIWTYTGEFFIATEWEQELIAAGTIPDFRTFANAWKEKVAEVFSEATLTMPPADMFMQKGGKNGMHTEHLGFLLAEMQYMQRQFPGEEW
ncbi:MAG: phenylacetate-CoA oxygenase subunit PaaI [Chitinophagaceae bacterium]